MKGVDSGYLEEKAWIETLDGSLAAVPLAQMYLPIPSTPQKLHQRDVSGIDNLHGAGNPLQTELRLPWFSGC